jgi:hypothetical protein
MNRTELLALTPNRYLSGGFRTAAGLAHRELTSTWAMAAAEQLRAQGVTAERLDPVVAEAARTTAAPASGPGAEWLRACVEQVRADADHEPFRQHLAAVLRLLALAESTAAFNRQGVPPPPPQP